MSHDATRCSVFWNIPKKFVIKSLCIAQRFEAYNWTYTMNFITFLLKKNLLLLQYMSSDASKNTTHWVSLYYSENFDSANFWVFEVNQWIAIFTFNEVLKCCQHFEEWIFFSQTILFRLFWGKSKKILILRRALHQCCTVMISVILAVAVSVIFKLHNDILPENQTKSFCFQLFSVVLVVVSVSIVIHPFGLKFIMSKLSLRLYRTGSLEFYHVYFQIPWMQWKNMCCVCHLAGKMGKNAIFADDSSEMNELKCLFVGIFAENCLLNHGIWQFDEIKDFSSSILTASTTIKLITGVFFEFLTFNIRSVFYACSSGR